MKAFFSGLVRKKKLVPIVFLALAAAGVLMIPLVTVNYDLAEYLPEEAGTKQAITVARQEFDYPGTAEVMAKDISLSGAAVLKQKIKAVQGVKSVLWLDDVTDIAQPVSFIPKDTLGQYYKDNAALFHVEFEEDDYAKSTTAALEEIRKIDGNLVISGNAESSRVMKDMLGNEMGQMLAVIVPVCIIILMVSSYCWLEPFLYIFVIGVSIAINMGTNVFFPNVSFITNSMAAVLQLAISMDYSIFLMHRYFEERDRGLDVHEAIVKACAASLSSISASALTTVAGFAALLFMQYRVGADIGLVLAKGVALSFVTVMLLMPVVIVILSKWLDRLRHKTFLPTFGFIGKGVVKVRFALIALALVIIIPSMLAQSRNEFLYGDNSASTGAGVAAEQRQEIIDKFGVSNTVMLMVPVGDTAREIALCRELEDNKHIKKVTGLVTIADSAYASSFIPESVVKSFRSEHYSRIIAYLAADGENAENYEAVGQIRESLERHYPGKWLAAGYATSLADIRDTVTKDSSFVTMLSLLAVGLIVLITFRSVSVPVVLLFVIQGSIWINMGVPYFTGFKIAYLGYLVISSLQLGGTIDYGILLTNRYLEFRRSMDKRNAAVMAVKTAGPSIMVSALILSAAGFGYGLMSKVDSIAELGTLIGRGALLSLSLTVLLLPALLMLFDRVIKWTTLKRKDDKT
jgi:predicted RND superfamily exporter protein